MRTVGEQITIRRARRRDKGAVGGEVKSKEGAKIRWSVRVDNGGAANNVHTTMQALILPGYTATSDVLLYVGWVQKCKKYRPTSHGNFQIPYLEGYSRRCCPFHPCALTVHDTIPVANVTDPLQSRFLRSCTMVVFCLLPSWVSYVRTGCVECDTGPESTLQTSQSSTSPLA